MAKMKKSNILFLLVIFLVIALIKINAEEDSQSIGKYSIKPPFKVDIDYNPFNEYKFLVNKMKTLLDKCQSEEDTISCINNEIEPFNNENVNLRLSLGSCNQGAKKIFYDFVENYESCSNSPDDDCICEFSFNFDYDYGLRGEYKLKLSKDSSIKLEKPEGIELNYILDTPYYAYSTSTNEEEKDYIDYYITYNDDGSFDMAKLGLARTGLDTPVLYDTVNLHKRGDKLVFVEEYHLEEAKKKSKCTITKNIFKFCAVNIKKQFYVYNPVTDKTILQNPTIKFALYMEDFPPPPINNLIVKDKPSSDKTVILEWDKSKAQDVIEYPIYYSKDNFIEWKMEKIHKEIGSKTAKVKDAKKLKSIDLTSAECIFDEENKICSFLFSAIKEDNNPDKIQLKNNELYMINNEKYIYILSLKDNEQHNFAVTAVDAAGNEIDNVNEKWRLTPSKNYNQGQSEDNLAPGLVQLNEPSTATTKEGKEVIRLIWSKPSTNIDGTALTDEIDYNIYYETDNKFDSANTLTARSTTSETSIDIDLSKLTKDKDYYFAVTAVDSNDNEFKEKGIQAVSIKTPQ